MTKPNPSDSAGAAGVGRRQFLTYAGALGIGAGITVLLASCHDSGSPTPTSTALNDVEAPDSIEAMLAFPLSSGFDPADASSATATAANEHIFEGLVNLDPITREPLLALAAAEPEPSDDGLTYTVALREGAKFSDGSAVSADDVAFSFTRIIKAETAPLMAQFLPFLENVEADDDQVIFSLNSPFAAFSQRIAVVKIVPASAGEWETSSNPFDTAPIGSGPYTLDSHGPEKLTFSTNEYYNGPQPPMVETMTWHITSKPSARIASLETGRVQAIEAVPSATVTQLEGKAEVDARQAFSQLFLMFNCAAEPFSDKRVRQALHYALDTELIITTALHGYGSAATSFFDQGNASYQKAATVYDYDPKKAKTLLKDAGAADLSFELIATDGSFVADIAPLCVDMWRQVGVEATLRTASSSAVYASGSDGLVENNDFQVLAASGDPAVFGSDADLLFRWWYSGDTWPGLRYRWDDDSRAKANQLLGEAAKAPDEDSRKIKEKDMIDFVAEEAALYPVLHRKIVTGWDAEKISNFSAAPITGLYFLDAERTA